MRFLAEGTAKADNYFEFEDIAPVAGRAIYPIGALGRNVIAPVARRRRRRGGAGGMIEQLGGGRRRRGRGGQETEFPLKPKALALLDQALKGPGARGAGETARGVEIVRARRRPAAPGGRRERAPRTSCSPSIRGRRASGR